jgi:hypothetical protein
LDKAFEKEKEEGGMTMDDLYESPITRIVANVQSQIEEQEGRILMKVVHDAGFDVDKHELMKALAYDRHQYEKGKSDAMKNAVPLDKLCEWLEKNATMDCDGCRATIGSCEDDDGDESVCNSRERWKIMLTKWMEGLEHG